MPGGVFLSDFCKVFALLTEIIFGIIVVEEHIFEGDLVYMKKSLWIVCMGLMLALTACNGKKENKETEEVTEAAATVATTEAETETETTAEKVETKILMGSAEGFGGTITVTIKMEGDDIIDADINGGDETPDIGGAALQELSEQLVKKDSYEIDGVSGATYTSEGVRNAAKDALGLYLDEKR